jgi:hypothetical protein
MTKKQKVLVIDSRLDSSILSELKKFAKEKGIELQEIQSDIIIPPEIKREVSEYLKMIDEAHKKAGNSKIMFKSTDNLIEETTIMKPSKNKKVRKNKKGSKTYQSDNGGRKFDYHGQRSKNLRRHTPTHRGR